MKEAVYNISLIIYGWPVLPAFCLKMTTFPSKKKNLSVCFGDHLACLLIVTGDI